MTMISRSPRSSVTRRCLRSVAMSGLLVHAAGAGAGDTLQDLRQVVDEACRCAAAHASGMDAALRCTDGPRAFGRLKVGARDGWNEDERAEARTLERIIETCIANALDRATARGRLGLAAEPGAPGAADAVWTQIRVDDLGAHRASLVRVHVAARTPLKGLVESVGADQVVLRRARSDGGGSERIPFDQIREVWVMRLP